MRGLERFRAGLRQRRQPAAFRIAITDDELAAFDKLLADVPPPAPSVDAATDAAVAAAVGTEPSLDEKQLADAATNLWRAQRRLARDPGQVDARARQTGRYLRNCREALTEAGLVVQDHDGDAFHAGRSLEVLTFEPDAALTTEVVLETVRPTIYLHDRRIQMGQVIVAGPPTERVGNDHARQ